MQSALLELVDIRWTEMVVENDRRRFRVFARQLLNSPEPFTDETIDEIRNVLSLFSESPLTVALREVKNRPLPEEAVDDVYRCYFRDKLTGMKNQPYTFSLRTQSGTWNHYQAYEFS